MFAIIKKYIYMIDPGPCNSKISLLSIYLSKETLNLSIDLFSSHVVWKGKIDYLFYVYIGGDVFRNSKPMDT